MEFERMVSFGRARFLDAGTCPPLFVLIPSLTFSISNLNFKFAVHVELRDVKNGRWMMEVVVDITST